MCQQTASSCIPSAYSRDDFHLFNILSQPIWIFDIDNKSMWWANNAAIELWSAESLDDLLARDFAEDMSDATEARLQVYLEKFAKGEKLTEQWTYYPKGKPITVNVQLSGILVEGGRTVMFNEGKVVPKEEIDHESLRGVEMLRHLPVSVSQFDMEGSLIHQNPEALDVFGTPAALSTKKRRRFGEEESCHFCNRFVDEELGRKAFQEVQNGNDFCIEAQQHTKHGPRWSSVKVRQARDPVTGEASILYSSRDITDVVEAKKEADQANARKSEFLAVMAHEIRTPLHQVIGFVDLLGQTILTQEQCAFVNELQNSSHLLMAVINDLLDYTKLEAGQMELESIYFEAKAVVEGSVSAMSSRAKEKGLELETCIGTGIPVKVKGDPNRLRQVLLNLLNNAIKFTHDGKIKASVECFTDNACQVVLRFTVTDTGIGIPEAYQNEIFQKYQQAGAHIGRNYGGTGLGLAICERLVAAMGGRIGVDSELGQGSTFWFEVPFDRADGRTEPLLSNTEVENPDDLPNGLDVLVAEDNKVNQKVVTSMLNRLGHKVTVAENGQKAIELLEAKKFDLIFMDIQMPVLDGIEATKEIRSRGLETPVVGLSASFQRSEMAFYKQVGMNDCISKPVLLKRLKATICQNIPTSDKPCQFIERPKKTGRTSPTSPTYMA